MADTKIRRFPPCPIYDTEKMELWLQDMAAEGSQIVDYSSFWGYFVFLKHSPASVHYRMEVVVNPQKGWDSDPQRLREAAASEEKIPCERSCAYAALQTAYP